MTRRKELHPLVQAAARSAERNRVTPERLAPEAVRTMAAERVSHGPGTFAALLKTVTA